MDDMTLKQVRDELWEYAGLNATRVMEHSRWADAIDAALKAQGEPVGYVSKDALAELERGDALNIRLWRSSDDFVGDVVEIYTAPPTDDRPTWEEVRHMLVRGYADGYEDHQCDISVNPGSRADRIIAEFQKEKGK